MPRYRASFEGGLALTIVISDPILISFVVPFGACHTRSSDLLPLIFISLSSKNEFEMLIILFISFLLDAIHAVSSAYAVQEIRSVFSMDASKPACVIGPGSCLMDSHEKRVIKNLPYKG